MRRFTWRVAVFLFTSVFFAFLVSLISTSANPTHSVLEPESVLVHSLLERDYTLIEEPEDYFSGLLTDTKLEEPISAKESDITIEEASLIENTELHYNSEEASQDTQSNGMIGKELGNLKDHYTTHAEVQHDDKLVEEKEKDEQMKAPQSNHPSTSSSTIPSFHSFSFISHPRLSTTIPIASISSSFPRHNFSSISSSPATPSSISASSFHPPRNGISRSFPFDKTFGSHPLPPLWTYRRDGGDKWVSYFHDQAIAMVHFTPNGTVNNCSVLEVIELWEQREALQYLGQVMPLQHVSLPHMVHLVSLCGALSTPAPTPHSPTPPSTAEDQWRFGSSALVGILPGTLWCGRRDQAESYHQLGPHAHLDSCCRTHDHCPVKLVPLASRYTLVNFAFSTKSHCLCELEFYRCLKDARDPLADTIGELYFNLLKMDCLVPSPPRRRPSNPPSSTYLAPPPPGHTPDPIASHNNEREPEERPLRLECSRMDSEGGCRMWLLNPKAPVRYRFRPSKLIF